jgi:sugar phosphate isomerase/epimerase
MSILGLKLWSTNECYIEEVKRLFADKICDYVEVYIVPDTLDQFGNLWRSLEVPFVIHAPHWIHGMNLSDPKCSESNYLLATEAFAFADRLKAEYLIFHPGFAGTNDEVIHQLNQWSENWRQRILIENKPYCSIIDKNLIANGHSPKIIQKIKNETGIGFCCDIGHCICSANSRKVDPIQDILDFEKLKPVMYHLSDNDFLSSIDEHKHFGQGNYDFKQILERIDIKKPISIETVKDFNNSLRDFENDVNFLRKIGV